VIQHQITPWRCMGEVVRHLAHPVTPPLPARRPLPPPSPPFPPPQMHAHGLMMHYTSHPSPGAMLRPPQAALQATPPRCRAASLPSATTAALCPPPAPPACPPALLMSMSESGTLQGDPTPDHTLEMHGEVVRHLAHPVTLVVTHTCARTNLMHPLSAVVQRHTWVPMHYLHGPTLKA
jgi:hypothetical protein